MSLSIIRKPRELRTKEELHKAFNILYKADETNGRYLSYENVEHTLNDTLDGFFLCSKSRINTKGFCPYEIKCQYIYDIKSVFTLMSQLGINLHWVLETFWDNVKIDEILRCKTEKMLYKYIWINCMKYIPETQRIDFVKNMIVHFIIFEINRIYKIYEKLGKNKDSVENYVIPLYHELGIENWGKYLCGFIDRIDRLPNGKLCVIDYKFGKPKFYYKNEYHKKSINVELGFYSILPKGKEVYILQKNNTLKHINDMFDYKLEFDYGSMLFFQDVDTFGHFPITKEVIQQTRIEINDYWYMVDNGMFKPKCKHWCYNKHSGCQYYKGNCDMNFEWLDFEKNDYSENVKKKKSNEYEYLWNGFYDHLNEKTLIYENFSW